MRLPEHTNPWYLRLASYVLLYVALYNLQVILILVLQEKKGGWAWAFNAWRDFLPGIFLMGPDSSLILVMYPLGLTVAVFVILSLARFRGRVRRVT